MQHKSAPEVFFASYDNSHVRLFKVRHASQTATSDYLEQLHIDRGATTAEKLGDRGLGPITWAQAPRGRGAWVLGAEGGCPGGGRPLPL